MNKALVALNVILLIALAYLYYAFFTKTPSSLTIKKPVAAVSSHIKIAYFDLDTLEKNYEYFKELRNYLKGRNDAMESKLNKMRYDYTAKVNDYNKRGASLSQTEQSQMQEDLSRMQNNFDQQQQSMNQEYQGEYMQKMLDVKTKIQNFLKTYSADRNYQYVFATSSDDNVIYYKDSVQDITGDVVSQLNADFKNKK